MALEIVQPEDLDVPKTNSHVVIASETRVHAMTCLGVQDPGISPR